MILRWDAIRACIGRFKYAGIIGVRFLSDKEESHKTRRDCLKRKLMVCDAHMARRKHNRETARKLRVY